MADVNDIAKEGRQNNALKMILDQELATSLNRSAAAALTVACAILKANYLSRGEQISDEALQEEVQKIYWKMQGLTDPKIGLARRLEIQQKPK